MSIPDSYKRRAFVGTAFAVTTTLAFSASGKSAISTSARERLGAVAFDAFTLFDPRPVGALAEQLFPGNRGALSRTRAVKLPGPCWQGSQVCDEHQAPHKRGRGAG